MNWRRSIRPSLMRNSLVLVLCGLAPAFMPQPLADARPANSVATAAHRKKCPDPKVIPCKGSLESEYNYNTGGGEGDLAYLWARFTKPVRTHREVFVPLLHRMVHVTTRKVVWKAARNVEIVAVYKVIYPVGSGNPYSRKLRSSTTGGRTTLEGPETFNDPSLVIEGRRTARAARYR
jgi:hypothetical protein